MIRPLIEDFLIYYSVPNGFNKQGMTKAAYMDNDPNADSKYYTPLFIDLVDDSNQADYYRLFEVESSDDPLEVTYVNDNIEIKAYYLLNDLLYHSNTLVQLKANLLNEADQLRITEEAIEEFFEFYNI
jgi:hypothetical protein